MKSDSAIDPRLRVLFLVAAAVGIFLLPRIWMAATAAGVLSLAWLLVGLPPKRLVRQFYKLMPFGLFIDRVVCAHERGREPSTAGCHWHRHRRSTSAARRSAC